MVSLEAKYQLNCLQMLYNKATKAASRNEHGEEAQLHGIGFIVLVAFMEETRGDDCVLVFKLPDFGDLNTVHCNSYVIATVGHQDIVFTNKTEEQASFGFSRPNRSYTGEGHPSDGIRI